MVSYIALSQHGIQSLIRKPECVHNQWTHCPSVGCGTIELFSSLQLNNVLHVPKLMNSLISIHKLTKDQNCAVTFLSHCVFQDLATRKTISVAKEQGGLYYLINKRTEETKKGS